MEGEEGDESGMHLTVPRIAIRRLRADRPKGPTIVFAATAALHLPPPSPLRRTHPPPSPLRRLPRLPHVNRFYASPLILGSERHGGAAAGQDGRRGAGAPRSTSAPTPSATLRATTGPSSSTASTLGVEDKITNRRSRYPEGTRSSSRGFERPVIQDVRARPNFVESTSGRRGLQMVGWALLHVNGSGISHQSPPCRHRPSCCQLRPSPPYLHGNDSAPSIEVEAGL
ncbi:uncharacterized protein LOC119295361 [Triticum dicoccoides]|uniref:uncharacterized protein LOC119295361 n=1 Tax=Triticum dicoccoides TaxID=85692 RepID=UPI00188F9948|nr:uncharacterized protein LOC119295361 [Triticum dicoccoides]